MKRRDCLTHLLAQAACALYWFNPLAWMAVKRVRTERERACDDLVLASGTRGSDYADQLLEMARVHARRSIPGAPGRSQPGDGAPVTTRGQARSRFSILVCRGRRMTRGAQLSRRWRVLLRRWRRSARCSPGHPRQMQRPSVDHRGDLRSSRRSPRRFRRLRHSRVPRSNGSTSRGSRRPRRTQARSQHEREARDRRTPSGTAARTLSPKPRQPGRLRAEHRPRRWRGVASGKRRRRR